MENDLVYNHYSVEKLTGIKNMDEILDLLNKTDTVFFHDYSAERNTKLNQTILSVCDLIDANLDCANELSKEERSFLYFSKSLCLDKLPEYNKKAEESADKNVF